MRCTHAHDSGAYVLGALSPAEREQYEGHLRACVTCRTDVAELAVLPGLLGRLETDAAEGPVVTGTESEPRVPRARMSERSLPSLLLAARTHRRRVARLRRWQMAGVTLVAACAAVLATVGVQSLQTPPPDQPPRPSGPVLVAMRPVAQGIPMTAEIALREAGEERTEIRMHCHYDSVSGREDAPASTFRLIAVLKSGAPETQLGLWTAGYGDDMNMVTTAHVDLNLVDRIELRRNDSKTALLTYELP